MSKKETALLAMCSGIPYVGGPISVIVGDYLNKRKEDRIFKFIENLESELSQKQQEIVSNYINGSEFLDVFENTLRKIVFERQEKKRTAYKNILLNSIITEGTTYDDTEEYQHYVSLFRVPHFKILKVFYEFSDLDVESNRDNRTEAIFALCGAKCQTHDKNLILEYIGDLETYKLIDGYLADYGSRGGNSGIIRSDGSKITEKGKRFFEHVVG